MLITNKGLSYILTSFAWKWVRNDANIIMAYKSNRQELLDHDPDVAPINPGPGP